MGTSTPKVAIDPWRRDSSTRLHHGSTNRRNQAVAASLQANSRREPGIPYPQHRVDRRLLATLTWRRAALEWSTEYSQRRSKANESVCPTYPPARQWWSTRH